MTAGDELKTEEPVVLLGGSFGGLIAYTYAGLHPDRVAGIVLLDPTLPDEPALDHAYSPRQDWLTPESWRESAEEIDVYRAYFIAQRALPKVPVVPGTIFVTKRPAESTSYETVRNGWDYSTIS